jgi:hypothetical protein
MRITNGHARREAGSQSHGPGNRSPGCRTNHVPGARILRADAQLRHPDALFRAASGGLCIVRNIRVADRADWVANRRPDPTAHRHPRVRDLIATLPIALLIPAVLLIGFAATAASPSLNPARLSARPSP